MTIEEAIKVLERVEDYVGIHYINGVEGQYINPYPLIAIDFAIAALREQEERRWIPVTERLPDIGAVALAYSKIAGIFVDYYEGEAFGYFDVTHWMPMPEPPKGE